MKYRNPLPSIVGRETEAPQKVLDFSRIVDSGCWEWQRQINCVGYGWAWFAGLYLAAHRLAYLAFKGPFDPMMDVCHTCDNRKCCNPDHLWLGNMRQNIKDSQKKGRHFLSSLTHCKRGHEFSPENTKISIDLHGHRHRRCLSCERARDHRRAWLMRKALQDSASGGE